MVEYEARLREDEESVEGRKRRLDESAGKLELAIDAIIG